jgi:hypothetical protein
VRQPLALGQGYVEIALTLKVDHQDEQYGFSSNRHVKEAKTRNPLFIGGLPGTSNPIYFDFLFLFQIEI